jgi:serine/threonine protein kinase
MCPLAHDTAQIVRGLNTLHNMRILHRDIKVSAGCLGSTSVPLNS